MRAVVLVIALISSAGVGHKRHSALPPHSILAPSDTTARTISADSARLIARTWLTKTVEGSQVFLDSTRTFDADSEWQVSFARRINIRPSVVLVGVNKTSREVRYIPTR